MLHVKAKANKKCRKDSNKNEEFSYLNYLEVSNLYACAMSQKQKFPIDGFNWV